MDINNFLTGLMLLIASFKCDISVYDTTDFSLINQVLFGEDMMLDYIEFDKTTNTNFYNIIKAYVL